MKSSLVFFIILIIFNIFTLTFAENEPKQCRIVPNQNAQSPIQFDVFLENQKLKSLNTLEMAIKFACEKQDKNICFYTNNCN